MLSYVYNIYNSYFDVKTTLPKIENSLAYLFEDEKQIIFVFVLRDGFGYQVEKKITFKNGTITQQEMFFIADYHSLKDRIWNLYYNTFSNSEKVNVNMRHHTLGGEGSYSLNLRTTTIEMFKQYLNNDIQMAQNNLMDFKRYTTLKN